MLQNQQQLQKRPSCDSNLNLCLPCQARRIWVSALPTAFSSSPSRTSTASSCNRFLARASPVEVQLLEEDLCSCVSIGDLVDIIGQACIRLPPQKAAVMCLADIQVPYTGTPANSSAACVLVQHALLHYVQLHTELMFISSGHLT